MESGTSQGSDGSSYLKLLRTAEEKTRANAWEDAAALWAGVVAINPTQGLSWARLGQARYHSRQYREAIPAFEQALELGAFPDLHEYEYNYRWRPAYDIARCYALLAQKEQALAWLERALVLGYRERLAIRGDEDLRVLHDEPRFQELVGLTDASGLPRNEGWQYDLAFLAREIKRIHYDPFRQVSSDEFDRTVQQLHDDIPNSSDEQVMLGIMRLVRKLGDGHSTVALWELGEQFPDVPVDFYLFTEGLFVTAAAPEYKDMVGTQVVAFGDHSVEDVIEALDHVISRDNAMGVQRNAPSLMRKPRILHGLGLIPDPITLPITIRDADGTMRDIRVAGGSGPVPYPLPKDWHSVAKESSLPLPLYLRDAGHYWFEYLPDEKVVYFHYRTVREHPDESFEHFCGRLFACIDAHEVEKFVIDMRWNGGGNTLLHVPLFRGIARNEKLRQGARLFVIIGRQTFSAAMNGVTYLESKSLEWDIPVIFVGEPTGSSPNFVGETVIVTLPYSKLPVSISDLYWQTSWPMDERIWLAPQLYAPPTFAAYRRNSDPALETILAYQDSF